MPKQFPAVLGLIVIVSAIEALFIFVTPIPNIWLGSIGFFGPVIAAIIWNVFGFQKFYK